MDDCAAADAASFAMWLRQEIVPVDAEIHFNIRPAAENDMANRILPTGDLTVIEETLLGYVTEVLAAQERGEL
ncbi:hypothetical protein ACWGCW_41225 [Streptomyces sp. NPDC054933]